jgi:hypothetical protein
MKSIDPHGFVVGFAVVVGATVAPIVTDGAGATLEAATTAVAVVAGAAVGAVVGIVVEDDVVGNALDGVVGDDDVVPFAQAPTIMASAIKLAPALPPRIVMPKG